MNIVQQSSKVTVIVENKCNKSAQGAQCEDDSDYSLLSVYETSENPLIRELIGTYTIDIDSPQVA